MPRKGASTITVKGREYDVDRDFSWKELILVEELARTPLGAPGALHSTAVGAAFIYIVLKREDDELTWEQFLESPVSDVASEHEDEDGDVPDTERPTVQRGSSTRARGGARK